MQLTGTYFRLLDLLHEIQIRIFEHYYGPWCLSCRRDELGTEWNGEPNTDLMITCKKVAHNALIAYRNRFVGGVILSRNMFDRDGWRARLKLDTLACRGHYLADHIDTVYMESSDGTLPSVLAAYPKLKRLELYSQTYHSEVKLSALGLQMTPQELLTLPMDGTVNPDLDLWVRQVRGPCLIWSTDTNEVDVQRYRAIEVSKKMIYHFVKKDHESSEVPSNVGTKEVDEKQRKRSEALSRRILAYHYQYDGMRDFGSKIQSLTRTYRDREVLWYNKTGMDRPQGFDLVSRDGYIVNDGIPEELRWIVNSTKTVRQTWGCDPRTFGWIQS